MREEIAVIEHCADNLEDTMQRILHHFRHTRNFKEVQFEFYDNYHQITPVYYVDPLEKVSDLFLCNYLYYKIKKLRIIKDYNLPDDRHIPQTFIYNLCEKLATVEDLFGAGNKYVLV